jgi:hypothetical protein
MSILKSTWLKLELVLVALVCLLVLVALTSAAAISTPRAGCVGSITDIDDDVWTLVRELVSERPDGWTLKCKYDAPDNTAPTANCVSSIAYSEQQGGSVLLQTWVLVYQKVTTVRTPPQLVCLYHLSEIIGDSRPTATP